MNKGNRIDLANLAINLKQSAQLDSLRKEQSAQFDSLREEQSSRLSSLAKEQSSRFDSLRREMTTHGQKLEEIEQLISQEQEEKKVERLEQKRQQQMRDIVFEVKVAMESALEERDPIARGMLLAAFEDDLEESEISANEFKEFKDKEFAYNVIASLEEEIEKTYDELSEQDINDLEIMERILDTQEPINTRLEEVDRNRASLVTQLMKLQMVVEPELTRKRWCFKPWFKVVGLGWSVSILGRVVGMIFGGSLDVLVWIGLVPTPLFVCTLPFILRNKLRLHEMRRYRESLQTQLEDIKREQESLEAEIAQLNGELQPILDRHSSLIDLLSPTSDSD